MSAGARIGDLNVCAHGIGAVVGPASPTVFVEGGLAARVGDLASCASGTSLITEGAGMVVIGGLPAARMTSGTAHGGMIGSGAAMVQIGGMTFRLPANIKIKGDFDFQTKVLRDLAAIWRTPTGRALLASIEDKKDKTVTIQYGLPYKTHFDDPNDTYYQSNGKHGDGSDSTIQYDPDRVPGSNAPAVPGTTPPAIGLGHELVHADQGMHGTQSSGTTNNDSMPDPNDPTRTQQVDKSEAEAAGIPPNDNRTFNENKMRSEWKDPQLLQRTEY